MTKRINTLLLLCMAIVSALLAVGSRHMERSNERYARSLAAKTLYEPQDGSLAEMRRFNASYESYRDAERKYLDAGKRARLAWSFLQLVGQGSFVAVGSLLFIRFRQRREAKARRQIVGYTNPQRGVWLHENERRMMLWSLRKSRMGKTGHAEDPSQGFPDTESSEASTR